MTTKRRKASTKQVAVTTDAATVDATMTARVLDGFANLTARLGVQPGAENVLSDGMYLPLLITRNRVKLETMYRGSWIVGAVIDSVAEDMVRAGISIHSDDPPDVIQKLTTQLTRGGIWQALTTAIKWGRLYGGALAVIDIKGQDPSSPLDLVTVGLGQFAGLKVFDRWQLQPNPTEFVQEGRDAGLPIDYTVISDLRTVGVDAGGAALKLHHSRVVRLLGIELPVYQAITEQMWGESIIERLYDRLLSFDTATMGAANLLQRAHLRTVQIKGLRDILFAGGEAETNLLTMFAHMRLLQNNEGLTLLDADDVFEAHSYSFSGLSDIILQFGQQVSGATGIPLVRLFGQSPAGLNSTGESDMRMYYDGVAAQQESRLRDGLHRVLMVQYKSLFGKPAPDGLDFDFVPLWQLSGTEKSQMATALTTAIQGAFAAGVIDQATALKELRESSTLTGVFTNITDEMITEAEAAPPVPGLSSDPGVAAIQQWTSGAGGMGMSDPRQVGEAEGADPEVDAIKAWTEGEQLQPGAPVSAQPVDKSPGAMARILAWVRG